MSDTDRQCTHTRFTSTGQVESCITNGKRRYRVTFDVKCEVCGLPFGFFAESFDGVPVIDGQRKLQWEIYPAHGSPKTPNRR